VRCTRVELWIVGFRVVKFDGEKEPVKMPMHFYKPCIEEAVTTARNGLGHVFHWCAHHAKEPTCGATQLGTEEGDVCYRDGCLGRLEYPPPVNCYCHLNPPCGACMAVRLTCPDCDWEEE